MSRSPADLVRRFYAAFNDQDIDALAATLDPAVELQTARGLREGIDEAREWATKAPTGELDQRIALDEVRADAREAHAVALIRKQWWWIRERELADESAVAVLFTLRDGRIARMQPFEDRDEALGHLDTTADGRRC